jgi:hypothetical protein
MKYHPGLGAFGAIVMSTNGTTKLRMKVLTEPLNGTTATGPWTPVTTASSDYDLDQAWHTICQYNSTSGYLLVGGGNDSTSGKTTFILIGPHPTLLGTTSNVSIITFPDVKRADSPVALGCSEGSGANKGCVVPFGSGFIAFHRDGVFELDVTDGTWTQLGPLPSEIGLVNPSEFSTYRLTACSIEEDYGVIALIKHGGGTPPDSTPFGDSAMWVYKP